VSVVGDDGHVYCDDICKEVHDEVNLHALVNHTQDEEPTRCCVCGERLED